MGTLAETDARERFSWSSQRSEQLDEALKTCLGDTVAERARYIAAEHNWPVAAVRNRLYAMQSPHRTDQPAARESDETGAATEQEGDQHAAQREAVAI